MFMIFIIVIAFRWIKTTWKLYQLGVKKIFFCGGGGRGKGKVVA